MNEERKTNPEERADQDLNEVLTYDQIDREAEAYADAIGFPDWTDPIPF